MSKKLIIKLVKSPIGYDKTQKATVVALGFKKSRRVVEHDDNPVIRGMIHKISHLLEVEEK